MRVEAVPKERLRQVWPLVVAGVAEIQKICHEPWIPEDVYAGIKSGRATLWMFLCPGFAGFSVTEVCPDDYGRFLNVWLLHLVNRTEENRAELLDWLDNLARFHGCPFIRFQSPRAWAKLLGLDFTERAVIYERVVK